MRSFGGEHLCASEDETAALAADLAGRLAPGDWVLLSGPLGAGKTAFVRGLARGLGIDPARVHSPTFTLVTEYHGPSPLAHVDLYRIERPGEMEELGLDELARRGIHVAVEWAERLPGGTAPSAWRVEIRTEGGDRRTIAIHPPRSTEN